MADDTVTVTLHWLGDTATFTNGVPNRDITTEDTQVDEELAELAVATGTHERA